MNISSLVWKYEIVSELCSGNDFGTDGRNDGMTDGRMTPKPLSPFHFVAGDNNVWLRRWSNKSIERSLSGFPSVGIR